MSFCSCRRTGCLGFSGLSNHGQSHQGPVAPVEVTVGQPTAWNPDVAPGHNRQGGLDGTLRRPNKNHHPSYSLNVPTIRRHLLLSAMTTEVTRSLKNLFIQHALCSRHGAGRPTLVGSQPPDPRGEPAG